MSSPRELVNLNTEVFQTACVTKTQWASVFLVFKNFKPVNVGFKANGRYFTVFHGLFGQDLYRAPETSEMTNDEILDFINKDEFKSDEIGFYFPSTGGQYYTVKTKSGKYNFQPTYLDPGKDVAIFLPKTWEGKMIGTDFEGIPPSEWEALTKEQLADAANKFPSLKLATPEQLSKFKTQANSGLTFGYDMENWKSPTIYSINFSIQKGRFKGYLNDNVTTNYGFCGAPYFFGSGKSGYVAGMHHILVDGKDKNVWGIVLDKEEHIKDLYSHRFHKGCLSMSDRTPANATDVL